MKTSDHSTFVTQFCRHLASLALLLAPLGTEATDDHYSNGGPRRFIDTETALAARFGEAWRGRTPDDLRGAIVALAESLPVGGAIDLPAPCRAVCWISGAWRTGCSSPAGATARSFSAAANPAWS